ncbi:XylR family transcriptional regulator [Aeoliella mucimassa]|uniref:Xylose operon regulatory protein n=1 Tax=Aeoliella mucimassa TaxID=2527972 RepID=A0A518ANB4_9BACT|nr:XylR family transcriptional regulator [Aeoliella mucimassa]QDU56203.1 Xylose operon regulatory protein [Aeoliella mucimassa]
MKRKPRVAILVESATTYGRAIIAGIARHQRSHSPWSTYMDERELGAAPPTWLLKRQWDGIICRATNPALAKAIAKQAIPTVDLNDLYDDLGLPHIQSDMSTIGCAAAQHLYERGFRNFAFCGFVNEKWSSERLEGFESQLHDYHCTCEVYQSAWRGATAPEWDADQERIAEWLLRLPKPLGVAACNDVRGQHVLNACMDAGVFVPEQVAVVGVDNNELLCNFCNPPLSSVVPDAESVGYEAASWLDALMGGRRRQPGNWLLHWEWSRAIRPTR